MDSVELRICYRWTCDNCAEVNYVDPIAAELTVEQAESAYRKFSDLEQWSPLPDNWRDFELCQVPSVVKCKSCGEQFRAIDEERI